MIADSHALIARPQPNSIDLYVQRRVARTNGKLYAPLINKLPRYPIPSGPAQGLQKPATGSRHVLL